MSTSITKPCTKAEAQVLTDRIRQNVDQLWSLLLEAHDRRAWRALGYDTFDAYVRAELPVGARRAYQLIDQGSIIREISAAAGIGVNHGSQISERAARDIKPILGEVTAEIKARVATGESPVQAAADVVAEKRAAKAAERIEHDRQREAVVADLPDHAKQSMARTAAAAAPADPASAELEELREANAAFVVDIERLNAEVAKFEGMRVQYEQGGFEKVIAGKDEEIRILSRQVETESRDKAGWKRSADYWKDEAIKLGWSNTEVIPLDDPADTVIVPFDDEWPGGDQ